MGGYEEALAAWARILVLVLESLFCHHHDHHGPDHDHLREDEELYPYHLVANPWPRLEVYESYRGKHGSCSTWRNQVVGTSLHAQAPSGVADQDEQHCPNQQPVAVGNHLKSLTMPAHECSCGLFPYNKMKRSHSLAHVKNNIAAATTIIKTARDLLLAPMSISSITLSSL